MSSTSEDALLPKQLETSQESNVASDWAHLPTLILTEVFSLLTKKDRRNASAVCKHWRENYFQPRWWRSMKFVINPNKLERAEFLSNAFGIVVWHPKIVLNSMSGECLKILINLLQNLAINDNMEDLIVEYTPIDFELLDFYVEDEDRPDDLAEVTYLLNLCLPRLARFASNCVGDLSLRVGTILENLNPSLVTRLRLTSTANFSKYYCLDPELLSRFTQLKELSIDQRDVTDEILDVVGSWSRLRKFVIHHRAYMTNLVDASGEFGGFEGHVLKKLPRSFTKLFKSEQLKCRIHTNTAWPKIEAERILRV